MFKAYERKSVIFHSDTIEELNNIVANMLKRLKEEDGIVETLSNIHQNSDDEVTFIQTLDYAVPIIKL